jgi:hypothetical protein
VGTSAGIMARRPAGESRLVVALDGSGEPADSIAERALAQYRARLEGGPGAELPSVDMHAASTPGPAP